MKERSRKMAPYESQNMPVQVDGNGSTELLFDFGYQRLSDKFQVLFSQNTNSAHHGRTVMTETNENESWLVNLPTWRTFIKDGYVRIKPAEMKHVPIKAFQTLLAFVRGIEKYCYVNVNKRFSKRERKNDLLNH